MHIYNQCACLCICQNKQIDLPSYQTENKVLPWFCDKRDFGGTIPENLPFSKNCNNIVKQARSVNVIILKSFMSHDVNIYVKVFTTCIRLVLE